MKTPVLNILITILLLGCSLWTNAATSARQTLLHNGIERSYAIYIPDGLVKGSSAVPLVLVLHGGGGSAGNAEKMTGFTDKAMKEGFIVVYPEGTGHRKNRLLTWNASHCCGYALDNNIDDVGFINTLIDRLIANYPVDQSRIYATGMSNGGMMTHRLGIELSHRFAAIAPVVATVFGDEKKPAHPVSAIMLNGKLDKSVPHLGGPSGGHFRRAWNAPAIPALEQGKLWAAANNCTGDASKDEQAAFTHWQYKCPAGHAVELYLVNDNGHAWPGGERGSQLGDKPGTALHGTDIIWNFFKAHRK